MTAKAPAMRWTVALAESSDPAQVGGKAARLAWLIARGVRVPDGFVVTTAAHIAAGGGALPEAAALEVIARYRAMGSPPVAVRSSATAEDLTVASMAGQYETILDVRDQAALLSAIERCWQSIDAARARAYLERQAIAPAGVAMAVVVQRMVAARSAGVLFTVDPRTGDDQTMVIEAGRGLGEAVVSGQIQPDTLVLRRGDGFILDARLAGAAACVNSAEVHALWRLSLTIESQAGAPQDLEWAIDEDGSIALLQARPITTRGPSTPIRARIGEEVRAARRAGEGPWVLSNLAETVADPTPLTWSLLERFHSGAGGLGTLYRMAGFTPGPRIEGRSILRLVAGQPFLDLGLAPDLFGDRFPFAYDVASLRCDPNASQAPPTVMRGSPWARWRAIRRLSKVARHLDALAASDGEEFEGRAIPEFRQWVAAEKERPLQALDGASLRALWEARCARVMDRFGPASLLPGLIAGHLLGRLGRLLAEHFWDDDGPQLALRLSAGGPADATVTANHDLFAVAQGHMPLREWIERHGHRGPGEFDLAARRWRERAEDVEALARLLADGEDPLHQHARSAERIAAEVAERRRALPPSAREEFDSLIAGLHRHLRLREAGKDAWIRGIDLLRDVAREIGRRSAVGDDIFLLDEAAVMAAALAGLAAVEPTLRARLARQAVAGLSLPTVLDDEAIAGLMAAEEVPTPGPEVDAWRGFGIAPGRASGPAAIVASPDADELPHPRAGYVLICRSTDPSWTPLFIRAAALVLERGGALSHGAVVARELGIPAVVLADARLRFSHGELLTVDGAAGLITRGDAGPRILGSVDEGASALAPNLVPPPPGGRERSAARVRDVALIGWLGFIAALLGLPDAALRGPIMAAFDAMLWPLVVAVGEPVAVAMISAGLALATILVQRIATDQRRLAAVKRRCRRLADDAAALPVGAPRRAAMLAAARGGRRRIHAAAWVSSSLLLGPLLCTCLWMQERFDPAHFAVLRGETIQVIATVHGEWTDPVTLRAPASLPIADTSAATQGIPPIRGALLELRHSWASATLGAGPRGLAERLIRRALVEDLDRYLDGEVPPQALAWTLHAGDANEVATVLIESGSEVLALRVAVGARSPPQPQRIAGSAIALQEARVVPQDRPATAFWRPLQWAGIRWDFGWLGAYLLGFLTTMAIAGGGARRRPSAPARPRLG